MSEVDVEAGGAVEIAMLAIYVNRLGVTMSVEPQEQDERDEFKFEVAISDYVNPTKRSQLPGLGCRYPSHLSHWLEANLTDDIVIAGAQSCTSVAKTRL